MKIGDYLQKFLNNDKFQELEEKSSVWGEWSSIVGNLSAHSRIFSVERGTLTVDADHPGWMQLIQAKEQKILFTLSRKYPQLKIKRIRFRLVENLQKPPKDFEVPEIEYAPTLKIEPYSGELNTEDPVLMQMMKLLDEDSSYEDKGIQKSKKS